MTAAADVIPFNPVAFYVEIIREHVSRSVESVLYIGQTLIEAKETLGTAAWLAMVETELGWKRSSAYTLIRLARHPVLSASNNIGRLPASWGTLELLARLDPQDVERGIETGTINPGMTRHEAAAAVRAKRVAREQAKRIEDGRRQVARAAEPATPEPQPDPAIVLRSIGENVADVVARMEILKASIDNEITRKTFGTARKNELGPAEALAKLSVELHLALCEIGNSYDHLAPMAGLPTREQA